MIRAIYNYIRKSWDSIKPNTDLVVENLKKYKRPVTYVSVIWILILVALAASSPRSSVGSSDQQVKFPSAAQQATIARSRDIGVFYPKMPADVQESKVVEVGVSEEKVLVSKRKVNNIHKKKKKKPKKQILKNGIQDPLKRIDLMLTKLELITSNIDTFKDHSEDAIQELHVFCKDLSRYVYVGTRPVENDNSRPELLDSLGRHAPTRLQIGDWRHTTSIPCVPRTLVVRWGAALLDLLEDRISESNPMKPFIHCLNQNTTFGNFWSERLTSRGDDPRSEVMFQRVQLEQVHHVLMKERLETLYENYQPQQIALMTRHLLHPDAEPVDVPIFNDLDIVAVRSIIRGLMLPKHRYGVIPQFTTTENRVAVDMFQIMSYSHGIFLEFHPLHPISLILNQEALYTKYIQKRGDISCKLTRTNLMTTAIVEARVNVSGVTFDLLRTMLSRIPLVNKVSFMVNGLTVFVEDHFPMEMLLQAGYQHSPICNFNLEQERLRNEARANFNEELFRANYNETTRDMSAEVVLFRAFEKRNYTFQMSEIHSRVFCDFRFEITIDFDLFSELSKITSQKQN